MTYIWQKIVNIITQVGTGIDSAVKVFKTVTINMRKKSRDTYTRIKGKYGYSE